MNNLLKIITAIIAIEPPITADIKLLKMCRQIFETKLPSILDGAIIKEYLKEVFIILILRFGIVLLIFLIFRIVIIDIERKKEIIMLFIPTNGVNIIKLANKTADPIM